MFLIIGKFFGTCGGIAAIFGLASVIKNYHKPNLFVYVVIYSILILLCIFSVFLIKNPTIAGACMILGVLISFYSVILLPKVLYMSFAAYFLILTKPMKTRVKDKKLHFNRKAGIVGGTLSLTFALLFIFAGWIFLHENDNPNAPISPDSVSVIIRGTILIIACIIGTVGSFITEKKKTLAGILLAVSTLITFCIYITINRAHFLVLAAIPMGFGAVRQLLLSYSISNNKYSQQN